MQIVHEQFHVEFIIVHLAARPSHPPLAKTEDDWLEFLRRGHWLILRSPLIGHRFPNDKPAFLELVQAFGQQSRRDLRQRSLEIIEARGAKHKLANNEKGLAFAQQFGSLGHRTDLTVADAHQREAKHYIQSS